MFDREKDGTLICSLAGGQSRKRIHSAKDYSGLEMMRVLRDECRNREIPVLEYCPAVELLTDEHGRCAGAILFNFDTERYLVVRARTVILATGGIGRLHIQGFPTTNHYGATADGLVVAYRAGARLLYMDAIQYHPTGAAWPEQMLGWLCTEALRGTGAHLVNVEGKRFINELETRDATSSAIIREVDHRRRSDSGRQPGVWLTHPSLTGSLGRSTGTRRSGAPLQHHGMIRPGAVVVYPTSSPDPCREVMPRAQRGAEPFRRDEVECRSTATPSWTSSFSAVGRARRRPSRPRGRRWAGSRSSM
jgi:succinate dehydrogenase / fumarate reductase flavoprotein subunit